MTNAVFKFPTGESHVRLDELIKQNYAILGQRASNVLYIPYDRSISINDHLMAVVLACETMKRFRGGDKFDLYLPYLPYSRQDRPTSKREPFSLKVIGNLLNDAPRKRLITLDVHSDSAYGCVNRLENIEAESIWLTGSVTGTSRKTLVIPDQGAFKKYSSYTKHFDDYAIALKRRDTSNGHLQLETIVGNVIDKHCVIMDDICDGGGTFTMLAKALLDKGAKQIDLVVTHGIFTKGTQVLYDSGIQDIYTTDSFSQTDERLKIRRVSSILREAL